MKNLSNIKGVLDYFSWDKITSNKGVPKKTETSTNIFLLYIYKKYKKHTFVALKCA